MPIVCVCLSVCESGSRHLQAHFSSLQPPPAENLPNSWLPWLQFSAHQSVAILLGVQRGGGWACIVWQIAAIWGEISIHSAKNSKSLLKYRCVSRNNRGLVCFFVSRLVFCLIEMSLCWRATVRWNALYISRRCYSLTFLNNIRFRFWGGIENVC